MIHTAHEELVILTAWMAREGWTADELAEAVREPWKFTAELRLAKAEMAAPLRTGRAS